MSPPQLMLSWVCKAYRHRWPALPSSSGGGGGCELTFLQKREILRDEESQPECDPGDISAS